ncbi:MAG: hypothetical protein OHK0045_24510 [Raineya sp.]
MKKVLFLLIGFHFVYATLAQKSKESKNKGKVTYLVVTDFKHKDTSQAPKITNMNATEAQLYFNEYESVFIIGENTPTQEVKGKDRNGNEITTNLKLGSKEGFKFYKNLKNNQLISTEAIFDKVFVILDTLKGISWNINFDKVKQIGNLTCTEATANYRGRKYTAWFTTQIPISQGPWKLYGLPGLILEAYDSTRQVNFFFKNLSLEEKNITEKLIPPPTKNVISFQEYKKRLIKKLKEFERSMQEQNRTGTVEIGTIEPLN